MSPLQYRTEKIADECGDGEELLNERVRNSQHLDLRDGEDRGTAKHSVYKCLLSDYLARTARDDRDPIARDHNLAPEHDVQIFRGLAPPDKSPHQGYIRGAYRAAA